MTADAGGGDGGLQLAREGVSARLLERRPKEASPCRSPAHRVHGGPGYAQRAPTRTCHAYPGGSLTREFRSEERRGRGAGRESGGRREARRGAATNGRFPHYWKISRGCLPALVGAGYWLSLSYRARRSVVVGAACDPICSVLLGSARPICSRQIRPPSPGLPWKLYLGVLF